MEVLMIKCDNPKCSSVGDPEHVPTTKRKNDKLMGPYGWHQGEGWLVGCGPAYSYMACSTDCVGPAIAAAIQKIHDEENERYR